MVQNLREFSCRFIIVLFKCFRKMPVYYKVQKWQLFLLVLSLDEFSFWQFISVINFLNSLWSSVFLLNLLEIYHWLFSKVTLKGKLYVQPWGNIVFRELNLFRLIFFLELKIVIITFYLLPTNCKDNFQIVHWFLVTPQ